MYACACGAKDAKNAAWYNSDDVNFDPAVTTWEYYLFSFLSIVLPLRPPHIPDYTTVMDANNVKEDIERLVKGFTSLDP